MISKREASCVEIIEAHLQHIDSYNPTINAIVTHTKDIALEHAVRADHALVKNPESCGPLHGLPIAHKDMMLTKGIRTTFGSTTKRDFIPTENSLIVERQQQAGAIMLGKTNTPEYGAGSHTFNEVFGVTRNPYDLNKSPGGSSGGAAAALAAGMVCLADGSDMGGSLRNPAAWCNVVGLRPTPGRVPSAPSKFPLTPLPVEGPMARNVADLALMLQAISKPHKKSPLSQQLPEQDFSAELQRDFKGTKIAVSADFGGQLPIEAEIVDAITAGTSVFADLGIHIETALPDLSLANDAFHTLRAEFYAGMLGETLDQHRDQYKKTLVWNIEKGLQLQPGQISRAQKNLQQTCSNFNELFKQYEFLMLPVTQVSPFPAEDEYPKNIENIDMDSYIDWMKSCYLITVAGCPAISIPCGFTEEGMPIGMQIVGRQGNDFGVLQIAYAFEQATNYSQRKPELVSL